MNSNQNFNIFHVLIWRPIQSISHNICDRALCMYVCMYLYMYVCKIPIFCRFQHNQNLMQAHVTKSIIKVNTVFLLSVFVVRLNFYWTGKNAKNSIFVIYLLKINLIIVYEKCYQLRHVGNYYFIFGTYYVMQFRLFRPEKNLCFSNFSGPK